MCYTHCVIRSPALGEGKERKTNGGGNNFGCGIVCCKLTVTNDVSRMDVRGVNSAMEFTSLDLIASA